MEVTAIGAAPYFKALSYIFHNQKIKQQETTFCTTLHFIVNFMCTHQLVIQRKRGCGSSTKFITNHSIYHNSARHEDEQSAPEQRELFEYKITALSGQKTV